jgi:hypothetical protein
MRAKSRVLIRLSIRFGWTRDAGQSLAGLQEGRLDGKRDLTVRAEVDTHTVTRTRAVAIRKLDEVSIRRVKRGEFEKVQ